MRIEPTSAWLGTGRAASAAWVMLCTSMACTASAESVRFVVSELYPYHHDSYVLPLSSPEAIAHSRSLIELGPSIGETIVFANIAFGGDGINRNVVADAAPPWSWRVTEFLGFGDLGIELYDGWPTFLESDVDGWIENTGGTIGFWTYTVTAELPAGDYDFDFDVDVDDYLVWKSSYGSTSDLAADGNHDRVVDGGDYVMWRNRLGTVFPGPPGSGGLAAVAPEPPKFGIGLLLAIGITAGSRGPRRAN